MQMRYDEKTEEAHIQGWEPQRTPWLVSSIRSSKLPALSWSLLMLLMQQQPAGVQHRGLLAWLT